MRGEFKIFERVEDERRYFVSRTEFHGDGVIRKGDVKIPLRDLNVQNALATHARAFTNVEKRANLLAKSLDAPILDGVAAAVEACQTCGAETTVCEISNKRRCSVGKFKGRVLVNIREYYEKDGQLLPGAKGAALSAEAAAILVANAEKIDERVREFGE